MTQHTDSATLKERVSRVLTDQVAPALAMDGASIEVVDVIDRVAQIRLDAAVCCPSSVMTVIMGIEQELRKHLPEIAYVELVP
jgi:Fe-S cluster biogenesis protein NfuA